MEKPLLTEIEPILGLVVMKHTVVGGVGVCLIACRFRGRHLSVCVGVYRCA